VARACATFGLGGLQRGAALRDRVLQPRGVELRASTWPRSTDVVVVDGHVRDEARELGADLDFVRRLQVAGRGHRHAQVAALHGGRRVARHIRRRRPRNHVRQQPREQQHRARCGEAQQLRARDAVRCARGIRRASTRSRPERRAASTSAVHGGLHGVERVSVRGAGAVSQPPPSALNSWIDALARSARAPRGASSLDSRLRSESSRDWKSMRPTWYWLRASVAAFCAASSAIASSASRARPHRSPPARSRCPRAPRAPCRGSRERRGGGGALLLQRGPQPTALEDRRGHAREQRCRTSASVASPKVLPDAASEPARRSAGSRSAWRTPMRAISAASVRSAAATSGRRRSTSAGISRSPQRRERNFGGAREQRIDGAPAPAPSSTASRFSVSDWFCSISRDASQPSARAAAAPARGRASRRVRPARASRRSAASRPGCEVRACDREPTLREPGLHVVQRDFAGDRELDGAELRLCRLRARGRRLQATPQAAEQVHFVRCVEAGNIRGVLLASADERRAVVTEATRCRKAEIQRGPEVGLCTAQPSTSLAHARTRSFDIRVRRKAMLDEQHECWITECLPPVNQIDRRRE
jgi:hypothetical protein